MKVIKSTLTMDNVTRHVDGGSRVSPKIALREIVVNSIEADATHIDINATCIDGALKAFVSDNGHGLTPNQAVAYLTKMGISGKDKSEEENFGQGARKATLGRNRCGVVWTTTRNGQTSETTVKYVPKTKTSPANYVTTTKVYKTKSGTPDGMEVMFMGNSAGENTNFQFGTPNEITSFLKNRFFNLPSPVEVSVFGKTFKLEGVESALNAISSRTIVGNLGDLKVSYYLLKDASLLSGLYVTLRDGKGMVEVYEHRPASELTKYGIDAAARHTAVVIELDTTTAHAQLDRTTLVYNDQAITDLLNDDAQWPTLLKSSLPEEVKKFEKEERNRQLVTKVPSLDKLVDAISKLYPGLSLRSIGEKRGGKGKGKNSGGGGNGGGRGKSFDGLKGTGKGVRIPEFREDTMEHMVEHNPETFSVTFDFGHEVATQYENQFTRLFPSQQRDRARAAYRQACRVLATEHIYTANYARLGKGSLSPDAMTANLLIKSRSHELARKLMKMKG